MKGTVAKQNFAAVPVLFLNDMHFYYIAHHEPASLMEKCLNSRKGKAANNFVSGNRLNHPRDMFRGKETPVVTFWFF